MAGGRGAAQKIVMLPVSHPPFGCHRSLRSVACPERASARRMGVLFSLKVLLCFSDHARSRRSSPSPYASIRQTKRLLDSIPDHSSPIGADPCYRWCGSVFPITRSPDVRSPDFLQPSACVPQPATHPGVGLLLKTNAKVQFDRAVTGRSKSLFDRFCQSNRC